MRSTASANWVLPALCSQRRSKHSKSGYHHAHERMDACAQGMCGCMCMDMCADGHKKVGRSRVGRSRAKAARSPSTRAPLTARMRATHMQRKQRMHLQATANTNHTRNGSAENFPAQNSIKLLSPIFRTRSFLEDAFCMTQCSMLHAGALGHDIEPRHKAC